MRFLMAAVAAALLASSVGCQTMGSRGCGASCAAPACGAGDCGECCACGDVCCDGDCCGKGGCRAGRGCKCGGCNGGCGPDGCGVFGGLASDPSMCPCGPGDSVYDFTPGPAGGQVAYPYYTTRGPRDFLMANPPSIGPSGAYGCR